MKTRMGSSAFTLLVGCVFGIVVGTVIFDRSPRVAFAKAAAPAQALRMMADSASSFLALIQMTRSTAGQAWR